ncbi:MAG: hypothetical protein ABJR46_08555 [Tateyamaria sp.]|uniref:hypothetical protein n=1 Tax=Tateyamaria sp. TaxID=1929288 RepID=UPI00329A9902
MTHRLFHPRYQFGSAGGSIEKDIEQIRTCRDFRIRMTVGDDNLIKYADFSKKQNIKNGSAIFSLTNLLGSFKKREARRKKPNA